jgi:hypothetical protein
MWTVIRPHRSTMIRRSVVMTATAMAVALSQSTCALGSEAPNPFFPSSSSTPKHTTVKTSKPARTPTRTSPQPKFPVPASERLAKAGISTPNASKTVSTPSTASSPITPTSSPASTATNPQRTLLGGAQTTPSRLTTPARRRRSTTSSPSGEAIVIATIAALLVIACLIWSIARWLALEPRWTLSLRHSLNEASFRISGTWADFADWARLGR